MHLLLEEAVSLPLTLYVSLLKKNEWPAIEIHLFQLSVDESEHIFPGERAQQQARERVLCGSERWQGGKGHSMWVWEQCSWDGCSLRKRSFIQCWILKITKKLDKFWHQLSNHELLILFIGGQKISMDVCVFVEGCSNLICIHGYLFTDLVPS